MATSTIKIIADSSQAQRSIDNLQKSVDRVTGAFTNMRSALSGIAFTALIANALRFADTVQDLSDATGIATSEILAFSSAVSQSGGSTDSAEKGILKLVSTIGEAADGSLAAQNAFRDVGVSLHDLRTLSEQDILRKVVKGLGEITDFSEQARLKTFHLGKEFRNVSASNLVETFNAARASGKDYSSAIKNAADAQDKLKTALDQLNKTLLQVIEPITKIIASLNTEAVNKFVDSAVRLGIVLGGIYAYVKALSLGLTAAVTAFEGATGAVAVFGAAVISAGTFVLKWMTILGRILAVVVVVNEAVKAMFDVDIIKEFIDYTDKAFNKLKEFLGFQGEQGGGAQGQGRVGADVQGQIRAMNEYVETLNKEKEQIREVQDALAKRRTEIERTSAAFKQSNQDIITAIDLEARLVGKSEEFIEIEKARLDIQKKTTEEVQKLQLAKSLLTKDEQALAATYDSQISKIREIGRADEERITSSLTKLQGLRAVENARVEDMKNLEERMERVSERQQFLTKNYQDYQAALTEVRRESDQLAMSPLEKSMADIKNRMQDNTLAAQRAYSEMFAGQELNIEESAKLAEALDLIAERHRVIAEEQYKNLENSRSFATGWKSAFNEYIDNATNAANTARTVFTRMTSIMENAIDKFVETGKFSFADFSRSVIQELLKIQLKAAAINMIKSFGADSSGNFFSSLLGFAEGGVIQTNKPVLVGENGPEMISGAAGMTVTPNNRLGGSTNNVTNNYYTVNAVDAKSVAQLFAENRKTLLGTIRQAEKELPIRGR